MSSRPSRRLFVTGIPAESQVSEVLRYFEHFGALREIATQMTANKTRAFVLTPRDPAAYGAILYPSSAHYFAGRVLQCAPYESGDSLLKHNIRNNRKRVIIKRVPSIITSEELRRWLEEVIGPVQSMFAYTTDDLTKRLAADPRKYRSYSVIFSNSNSVSHLLRLQRIQFINGMDFTTFEKFKPPREIRFGRDLGSFANQRTRDSLHPPEQKHAFGFTNRTPYHTNQQTGFLKFDEHNQCKSLLQISNLCFKDVNAILHRFKPCSKSYFSNSVRNLPSHLESSGNLLFKLAACRR